MANIDCEWSMFIHADFARGQIDAQIVNTPVCEHDARGAVARYSFVSDGKHVTVLCYGNRVLVDTIKAMLQAWKRGEWRKISAPGKVKK